MRKCVIILIVIIVSILSITVIWGFKKNDISYKAMDNLNRNQSRASNTSKYYAGSAEKDSNYKAQINGNNVVYIFYLPEWEKQAKDDIKKISAYYGIEEEQVILEHVANANELTKAWNEMGTVNGMDVNISAVIVNTHADPYGLNFGNEKEFTAYNISALKNKKVGNLILYGCNAGYLDNKDSNPAALFAKKVNGTKVLASDGTVIGDNAFWLFGTMKYKSEDDDMFKDHQEQLNKGNTRSNIGWIIYRFTNNQISISNSLGKELTLTQMLEKF